MFPVYVSLLAKMGPSALTLGIPVTHIRNFVDCQVLQMYLIIFIKKCQINWVFWRFCLLRKNNTFFVDNKWILSYTMFSVQQLESQMTEFDTETEMNEFFETHMEDIIAQFKRQAPEYKIQMMKKILANAESFLEYYDMLDN